MGYGTNAKQVAKISLINQPFNMEYLHTGTDEFTVFIFSEIPKISGLSVHCFAKVLQQGAAGTAWARLYCNGVEKAKSTSVGGGTDTIEYHTSIGTFSSIEDWKLTLQNSAVGSIAYLIKCYFALVYD
jgi:hypothetical protein